MLPAVTTPWFKSAVLGLALLGLGATAAARHDPPGWRRLVLQTVSEPDTFYLSAFRDGDLRLSFPDGLRPITFHTRASVTDGCRWLGIEKLVPLDANTYAYAYSEVILDCAFDAKPADMTPRIGLVHVE
ncbi:MAG: hypothetical protein WKG01_01510 [Kofleriaceae bacterium]